MIAVSIDAVRNMLGWCEANQSYFFQVASSEVCGTVVFATVSSPIFINKPYTESKWLSEKIVNVAKKATCIVCFGGIFGRMGPNHLRINRVIRGALSGDVPTIYGAGHAKRNYIPVSDVAKVVASCLLRGSEDIRVSANQEVLSIRAVIEAMCELPLEENIPRCIGGAQANDQMMQASADLPPCKSFW